MAEIGRSDARYDRFGAARLPTTAAIRNTALSGAPVLLILSLIWPASISAALGSINLPAHRIVLIVLLPFAAAELVRTHTRFKAPDIFVFAFAALQAVSLSIHHGLTDDIIIYLQNIPTTTTTLINAGATFIDTVGPYLVARAYIRTLPQFLAVARLLVSVVIVIGVFTLVERNRIPPAYASRRNLGMERGMLME
ncbi:hypothetical protein [Aerococcus urinae]|uniref:hypothetical protein n=1 Tax=Aerococcus urinae TaxID=1376 RepID=UPI002FE4ABFC